jgi:hypothetical protein
VRLAGISVEPGRVPAHIQDEPWIDARAIDAQGLIDVGARFAVTAGDLPRFASPEIEFDKVAGAGSHGRLGVCLGPQLGKLGWVGLLLLQKRQDIGDGLGRYGLRSGGADAHGPNYASGDQSRGGNASCRHAMHSYSQSTSDTRPA